MKKKKHIAACTIMAVAIAASIPLGINRSLSKVREDAADHYYYDDAGYSLYEGIEKRQEAASSLITVAERYVEQEPSLEPLINELDYRVQASINAYDLDSTFTKTVKANQAMDAPARELAQALEGISLAEKDQKYPAQLIDLMNSEQDKLKRSSYNDAARDFNAKLDRLKPAAMLDRMATFDQDVSSAAEQETAAIPDEVVEQVQEFAGETAEGAEIFAEEVSDWADQFSGEMSDWADQFSDEVADWADQFGDEMADRMANGTAGRATEAARN